MTESVITIEGNKLNPDAYVEMFEFDTTVLDPTSSILYYTNTSINSLTSLLWKGNSYQYFPFSFSGVSHKMDGTALAQPTLTVSNVHRILIAALLSIGDLTGTIVTRTRTFYKFTDLGAEPNPLAHYPVEQYRIVQKKLQNRTSIQYLLSTTLDNPNAKLPARQILRDFGFPGAGRIRRR